MRELQLRTPFRGVTETGGGAVKSGSNAAICIHRTANFVPPHTASPLLRVGEPSILQRRSYARNDTMNL